MTEIIVIAAVSQNNVIGKNNDIPWRIKEDFQYFKEKTLGFPCIMGEKTFKSLPDGYRPLPGRENIVLTFDKNFKPEGATVMHSFEEAIEYCRKKKAEKVFISGGASVYKLGINVADTLLLTRIYKDFDGDVFFPEINFDEWEVVKKEDKEGKNLITGEMLKFSFLTYKRKRKNG